MPGRHGPRLHVRGQVQLTEDNFTPSWTLGLLDRRAISGQRLMLAWARSSNEIERVQEVAFNTPALATGYSEVIVLCDDRVIASISNIEETY